MIFGSTVEGSAGPTGLSACCSRSSGTPNYAKHTSARLYHSSPHTTGGRSWAITGYPSNICSRPAAAGQGPRCFPTGFLGQRTRDKQAGQLHTPDIFLATFPTPGHSFHRCLQPPSNIGLKVRVQTLLGPVPLGTHPTMKGLALDALQPTTSTVLSPLRSLDYASLQKSFETCAAPQASNA